MAIDDVYLCSQRMVMNGKQIVNVPAFRRKIATEPTASDFATLCSTWKEAVRVFQVDDLTYTDWSALKVRGAGVTYNTTAPFRVSTVSFAGAYAGTLTGQLTGEPETQMAAAMVSLSTGQSGRRRRGRTFFAGLTVAQVADDGTLDNTQRGIIQGYIDAMVALWGDAGTDTDWEWGVWSDRIATNTALSNTWPRVQTSQGAPDPDDAYMAIVSATVRDYVGSQRDRRPGL